MSTEIDWPHERVVNVGASSGYRGIEEAGFRSRYRAILVGLSTGQRSRTC